MKITICGSIAFIQEMLDVKKQLENLGHEVKMPPTEVPDENGQIISVTKLYELRKTASDDTSWIWDRKEQAMRNHFAKEEWADVILVLNYDKKSIAGYVGANTLIEMGVAMHLNKPIYMLNPLPQTDSKEEILGMKPIVINANLSLIK